MSFVCESCKTPQAPGTEMNKVVTEVRMVQYPAVKDREGNIRIPTGFENVKELKVCPKCKNEKDFKSVVVDSKVLGKTETVF